MGARISPRYLIITAALALALCLLVFSGVAGSRQADAAVEDYLPGQVIVKASGSVIDEIIGEYAGVIRLDVGLPYNLAREEVYLVSTPDGEDPQAFANLLETNITGVEYAEPNFVTKAPEVASGDGRHRAYGISTHKSYDPYVATNLNLSCVPDTNRGAGSKVAVLDTGAHLKHPALEDNFRRVKHYDFVDNDTTPSDERYYKNESGVRIQGQLAGHGTHVAGIVDQVAPAAKIMPLRVLDPDGYGDVYTIARAITFAQAERADVINLSLGTPDYSRLLQEMITGATTEHDIVAAAAAGNSNTDDPHYPAAGDYQLGGISLLFTPPKEGLLAVTAVDSTRTKSSFANYGNWVGISAPGGQDENRSLNREGEGIRSTYLGGKYANWAGTSMATPFVAGQAALIRAVNDGPITAANIERKVINSADPIETNELTYLGRKLGAGHANVCKSLDTAP
jgi:subtilisin family serine protease